MKVLQKKFMDELKSKITNALILIFLIFLTGIAGYVIIEKWNIFDSLYMTVITLASVGYGETHELSTAGRIFTIVLIIAGMGTFVYAISMITAMIIEGELKGYLRRSRMKAKIDRLNRHYIVCGAGNVGRHVVDELYKTERSFVIIDNNPDLVEKLSADGKILCLEGDASADEVLIKAGIKRAAGLICALPADKDNLFVIITAKSLNPDLRIVSRAIEDDSIPKLKRAGADSIVSANAIGGLRIASEMIRPKVVSFLDKMLRSQDASLRVDELNLCDGSSIIGKTLKDADVTDTTGLLIIATHNLKTGEYKYNPKSSYIFNMDDVLITIGTATQMTEFKKRFKIS